MRSAGGGRPHIGGDRSGGPDHPQDGRLAPALAIVLLAGWAALACGQSGIDYGLGRGVGVDASALALGIGGPLAAAIAWRTRSERAWAAGPTRLAILGVAGLALWAAASIGWALQPELAWIEANQALLALAALVAGIGLGSRIANAAVAFGVGLAAAATVPIGWALLGEILPTTLGGDFDPGRLQGPTGFFNALALMAAMALPGALWLAGRSRRGAPALAAAWIALIGVALALTLSRGGLLAAGVAVALTIGLVSPRRPALVALVAGIAGAAWPVAYGLGSAVLTDDAVATALRRDAGLGLGWRLVVGLAIAAALAALVDRRGGRSRAGLTICVAAVALGMIGGGQGPAQGEATALAAAGGESAVSNDPGRVVSLRSNNRGDWWAEAWRGWRAAPIAGNGAGSFRLVHLRERTNGNDAFNVRQPHQAALKLLSDLGIVGLGLGLIALAGVGWALVRQRADLARVALALAALAAFLVHSQVDWVSSVPALMVAAAGAAGVLLASAAPGRGPAPSPERGAITAGALAAIAALAIGSAALPWWSAERARAASAASAEGRLELALDRAATAQSLNPLSPLPYQERAIALLAAGEEAGAIAARRELTDLQPDNPYAWAGLARLLGDRPQARLAWARTLELDPLNRDAQGALAAQAPAG